MKNPASFTNRKSGLWASVGLAAIALSSAASAQDASVLEESETTTETATEAESNAIVVTGSRITTVTPYNSPDPISIVSPEIARREGRLDLASALQSSPVASGSTQITSALSSNFVTNGGPGAQTIDLRGLGANRTLVLLNGRRAGPAGTRGAVSSFDLNVLPLSIVNDIQILKTGASSIYGSDAIAGVVNILTGDREDGLKLDLNVSVPFDSGGEDYRLSAAYTKNFSRGHITIAGDYSHTNELARGDRSYLACPDHWHTGTVTGRCVRRAMFAFQCSDRPDRQAEGYRSDCRSRYGPNANPRNEADRYADRSDLRAHRFHRRYWLPGMRGSYGPHAQVRSYENSRQRS